MLPDDKKESNLFSADTLDRRNQCKRLELLQSMPIFGGISTDTLAFLLEHSKLVAVRKDDYFYHEKDPAQSLFVLVHGKVMLLKAWHGEDYILKTLKPGNCFGEVALMDLQPRNTSSLAIEDSRAIEMTDDTFHQLFEREIEQFTIIRMNMAREVCRRLREADGRAFAADIQARRLKRPH
jgi:CRP-like cAMP-binding protein